MNESLQKPVSTLVIAEKRPQRPGGCVGIFFQLFDWNKRLAKKKLFSRKLLPSSRLKRAAKKFGEADNLPGAKIRLIADENRGGFPKKADAECLPPSSANVKHCKMQTPNLVARLMGLESMPVVHRNQSSKKVLASESCNDKESCANFDICHDKNRSSEKRNQRFEWRPQKLQKTGFFERAPVSKLGAEALQFRKVLLRSRKQHRKLASPVKSPRNFSGRKASRLMETATKILEPSLEATNRAKRFLPYSAVPRSRLYDQGNGASAPSVKPTWKEDNRCNSCGHFVNVDFSSNIEKQVPEYSSSPSDLSSSSGRSRLNPKFLPHEDEKTSENGRPLLLENQHGTSTHTVQTEQNVKIRNKNLMDREVYFHKDLGNSKRIQSDVASCKPKQNNQKQNAVWASNDLRSPKAYIHQVSRRDSPLYRPSRTKDYIALNRNLASQSQAKMHATVVENGNFDESATVNRMTEISARVNSLDRKRSFGSSQLHGMQVAESTFISRRNRSYDNKQIRLNAQCAQSSVKNEIPKKAEGGPCGGNCNADTVPFTFSSSLRNNNKSVFSTTLEKTQSISRNKKVSTNAMNRCPSVQRQKEQGVDALGALLEQKLGELTHLEMDESEKGVGLVGRSTAAILEELISALTQHNATKENADDLKSSPYYDSPDKSSCQLKCNQMSCSMIHSQGYSEGGPAVNLSLAVDSDNPSPTSIFEACFSNESNGSHSPDSGSGSNFRLQFADFSHHVKQQSSLETDKWDSASLMHVVSCGSKRPAFRKNDVSSINDFTKGSIELCGMWHADFWFGTENHIADPIFIKKIQALSEALEASDACGSLGFADSMTSNKQYKRFLVDCVMEFMVAGSAYYGQHKPKCWAWAKLPFVLTTEDLIKEVCREISKWKVLAGKVPDEIVEWELRRSTGVWNTSELESFKMGTEIEGVICQILIDEMVVDLW